MKPPFIGKRIVVFTAHPDDEGLASGTMYENHRAGGETTLVCATAGEKGKSHLEKPVSDAALKKIRRNELLAAAKILKIDHVVFLGFPDADVRAHKKELFLKGLAAVRRARPEYLLSFGPDGVSAHWDHISVGEAARKIAKELCVPLFAFTISPASIKMRQRSKLFLSRRKFGKYAGIPTHRKGDIKIKVDAAVKRRAMKNHRSQFPTGTPFAAMPKRLADAMFAYEHFVKEKL